MPKLELQINVRLLRRSMHSLTRGRHDIETTTNSPLLFNRFYPSRFWELDISKRHSDTRLHMCHKTQNKNMYGWSIKPN